MLNLNLVRLQDFRPPVYSTGYSTSVGHGGREGRRAAASASARACYDISFITIRRTSPVLHSWSVLSWYSSTRCRIALAVTVVAYNYLSALDGPADKLASAPRRNYLFIHSRHQTDQAMDSTGGRRERTRWTRIERRPSRR